MFSSSLRLQLVIIRSIKDSVVSPQAREDIISLIKTEKTRPEALEAHYGSGVPTKPLQALQRDGLLIHSNNSTDDVYEKPMAEVREEDADGFTLTGFTAGRGSASLKRFWTSQSDSS